MIRLRTRVEVKYRLNGEEIIWILGDSSDSARFSKLRTETALRYPKLIKKISGNSRPSLPL